MGKQHRFRRTGEARDQSLQRHPGNAAQVRPARERRRRYGDRVPGIHGGRHGRTNDLRPQWFSERSQRCRGPIFRQRRARVLLFAWSSHALFRPSFGHGTGGTASSPEVIAKPDVTATDGGANTFFGSCNAHTWRFYGTSAAAPHAAAVAALEFQAKPAAGEAQVRDALTETASPIVAFAPESGRVRVLPQVGSRTRSPGSVHISMARSMTLVLV